MNNPAQPALQEALDACIELLLADFGMFRLYQSQSHALTIVAHRGLSKEFLEYFSAMHPAMSSCGAAMNRRSRIIVEDVLVDPLFKAHLHIMAAAGCRAVQSTPIINRNGEFLGVLSTHFRTRHRPSERNLRLLDFYTRQMADSIDRQQASEEFRGITAEEMARAIAHEVNQPLAAIATNAAACARWLAMEPSNLSEANEALVRITRDARRAGEVIAHMRKVVQHGDLSAPFLPRRALPAGR